MKPLRLLFIMVAMLALAACGDDEETVQTTSQMATVSLHLQLPESANGGQLTDAHLAFYEVNTGKEATFDLPQPSPDPAAVTLPVGMYRLNVSAKLEYTDADGIAHHAEVQGYDGSIELKAGGKEVTVAMFITSDETDEPQTDPEDENHPAEYYYNGFVLAEIFCAGSATPQGSYYYADKYFVIYNNTDHVLYADSIFIAQSDFMTVMKEEYSPDIMQTDFAVDAIYMIPGGGHDVPVEPGASLLLVDNAVNHTVANPNSWNMTVADYEWYDESTNPEYTDIDNPNVNNLKRIYSKTLTMWSPHTQGFKSYAIGRMGTDERTFLGTYYYDYAYHLVGQTGEADMDGSCYRVPNSWLIDAVNVSVPAMFQWIVTAPQLDRGYTYCAEFGWDDSRYNKSMRRKVLSRDGNRAVLQDTNNSTDDFEPRVEADPFHKF